MMSFYSWLAQQICIVVAVAAAVVLAVGVSAFVVVVAVVAVVNDDDVYDVDCHHLELKCVFLCLLTLFGGLCYLNT